MGYRTYAFVASTEDLASCLAGWQHAAPLRDEPELVREANPFTGEAIEAWDYRNPEQPEPSDDAEPVDIDGLPQVYLARLGAAEVALLAAAAGAIDPKRVEGRINGMELIGAPEEEAWVAELPGDVVDGLAAVGDEHASKWAKQVADSDEEVAALHEAATSLAALAADARRSGRRVFLAMLP